MTPALSGAGKECEFHQANLQSTVRFHPQTKIKTKAKTGDADQWESTCLVHARARVCFPVQHIYPDSIRKTVSQSSNRRGEEEALGQGSYTFLYSIVLWQCKKGTLAFFTKSFVLGCLGAADITQNKPYQ